MKGMHSFMSVLRNRENVEETTDREGEIVTSDKGTPPAVTNSSLNWPFSIYN